MKNRCCPSRMQEKVKPIQFTNTPDWMIEAEIEDSKKENEEKK